ncbi:MAG: NADH-quinone oxidoreductase subunit N [Myxococcales bacterium]
MPQDLLAFLPEAAILLGSLALFAVAVVTDCRVATWRTAVGVALVTVAAALAALGERGEPFFPGIYRSDAFSQVLKLGLAIGLLLVTLVSREIAGVRRQARTDVPIFLALATAGMMLLVSSTELLTLYVALEMSALSLYIVAAFHQERLRGSEGAAKYVLFGAASSAVTLYGLSLVYGATGTTYVGDIVAHVVATGGSPLFAVGVLLALAGLLFKLAVFPFHAWAPDVYEAAPNAIVAFIGTASKVAAVGVLARVISLTAERPGALVTVLLVLSVLSMTIGNLAALIQKDLKRLLAWSTVAHGGYVLIGLLAFTEAGFAGAVFYGLAYLLMAFAVFLVVCVIAPDGENPTLDSLAGLHHRSPLLLLVLLLGVFGLAGIPPTPGFAGKWFLFSAALKSGHFWLVFVAAINATVSLYYYLIIVKAAFQAPAADRPPIPLGLPARAATWAAVAALLVIGVLPGPLWDLAAGAAAALLG